MEAVLVGLLTASTLILGAALWYLLVRPDVLLSLLGHGAVTSEEGWFEEHPAALDALRWVLAGAVFLMGFLTGLAVAFLGSTA